MSVIYYCDSCGEKIKSKNDFVTIAVKTPENGQKNIHLHNGCYLSIFSQGLVEHIKLAKIIQEDESVDKKDDIIVEPVSEETVEHIASVMKNDRPKPVAKLKPVAEEKHVEEEKPVVKEHTKKVKEPEVEPTEPIEPIFTNAACDFDEPLMKSRNVTYELAPDVNRLLYIGTPMIAITKRFGIQYTGLNNYCVKFRSFKKKFVPDDEAECEELLDRFYDNIQEAIFIFSERYYWTIENVAREIDMDEKDVMTVWTNLPWFYDEIRGC